MRTFQLISILLFLMFYAFISWGAIKCLLRIAPPVQQKKVSKIFTIISVSVFTGFILLYVWPMTTRNLRGYSLHLVYNAILSIDFVFKFSLTLSFLAGIFIREKWKPVTYIIGFILSVGISSSVLYGAILGRKGLITNNVELDFKNLPREFNGLRIAQISDTYLGGFMGSKKLLNKVADKIELINPEYVLFTGDLVNNFSDELDGWESTFMKITNNKKCYSILGNHDYGNYSNWKDDSIKTENFSKIVAAHKTFGFKLLNNEHVKLYSGKDSIYLIGVENWGHPPFPQYANLETAVNEIPVNAFKILLTHDPAHWDEVISKRDDIDLTLSGHTHGFQWGIQKAGITFSLSYFVRKNWGGLYNANKNFLYVNTGLGTVGIPWRINMPGELTVITLKRIEID